MQQVIKNINERLQKNNIPQDKKAIIQYFSKLQEMYLSLATHMEKKADSLKKEMDDNKEQIFQMMQKTIFFNFCDYVQDDVFARAFIRLCIGFINIDSNYVNKTFEFIQMSNKRPINKTIQMLCIKNIILQQGYMRMIAFPVLQEVFHFVIKQQKQSNDINFRIQSLEVLELLILEKVNSNYDNKKDSYKYITKYLQSEKSVKLRAQAAKTLQAFLIEINSGFLAGVYEQLHDICFKVLEESYQNWDLRQNLNKSLQILLKIYIKEDVEKQIQQLKIKKSKKETSTNIKQQDNQDKQSQNDFFKDILHLFNSHLDQYQTIRIDILEIFYNIISENDKNITANFTINVFELLFNFINKNTFQKEQNICLFRDVSSKFCRKLMFFLSQQGKQDFIEYLLKKLIDFGKVMKTTYERNNHDLKNKSFLGLQHQVITALRSLYQLVSLTGSDISNKFGQINQFTDSIVPLFGYQNHQIWMLGTQILKQYLLGIKKEQTSHFNHVFELVSIKIAELESCKSQNQYNQEGIIYASTIEGLSNTLQILINNIDYDIHSIPFEIGQKMFDTAKKIIKSDFELVKSKQMQQITSQVIQMKNQGMWNMINSILNLDAHWFKNKTSELFDLWQIVLGDKRIYNSNDDSSIAEINIKRKALAGVYEFLKLHQGVLDENILRFLANFVINFFEQLLSPMGKTDYRKSNDYLYAKIDLYKCLNKISPRLYSSKINTFVQSSIEDIFMLFSEDFTACLKYYISIDDLFICYEESNLSNRKMQLFSFNLIQNEIIIDKYDDQIVGFDRVQLNFKEQYILPKTLNFLQFEYLAKILSSNYFTPKNKINLLKYLYSNLNTIINAKDFINKHIKVMPYVLLGYLLTKSINEEQDKHGKDIEKEIIESLKSICQLCWSQSNETVRTLTAIFYAKLLNINSKGHTLDTHFKYLQDGLKNAENVQSIVATLSLILKYNNFERIQGQFLIIANLFQKCAQYQNIHINKWIVYGLSSSFKKHGVHNFDIFRVVFQTLYQSLVIFQNQSYNYLLIQNFEQFLLVLGKNRQLIQDKNIVFSQIHFAIWDVMHVNKSKSDEILQNNLKIQYSNLFKSQKLEEIAFLFVENNIQQIYYQNKNRIPKFLGNVKSLITENKFKLFNLQEIYQILTKNLNVQYLYQKREVIYQMFEQLLEIIEKPSLNSLKTIQQNVNQIQHNIFQIEFMDNQQNENEEENEEENKQEENQKKKKDTEDKPQLQPSLFNNVNITKKYKYYLSKKIGHFVQLLPQLLNDEQDKDVKIESLKFWMNILLRFCSVNNEVLKIEFMKSLFQFIKSIKYYKENGQIVENQKINFFDTEGDGSGMMISYFAAQLDSVITSNLKSFENNLPEINFLVFSLIRKLFKFILQDIGQLKILLQLLYKPIQNNILALQQKANCSDKQVSSLHLKRTLCLTKIYFFLIQLFQNKSDELNQINQFFSYQVLKCLQQNLAGLILDSVVIITMNKKQIQSYSNFIFIANGMKQSYNDKLFYDSSIFLVSYYQRINAKLNSQDYDEENKLQNLPEELQIQIKKNDEKLQKVDKTNYCCLQLLLYTLSSNCIFYKEELYLKKLTNRLQDLTLLDNFNQKLRVLDIVVIMMKSTNINIAKNDLELLQNLLQNYLDYSLFEYDIKILQIIKLLSQQGQKLKSSLIDSIMLRYHEQIKAKILIKEDFSKERQICIATFNLKFGQAVQDTDTLEQLSLTLFHLFQNTLEYLDLASFIQIIEHLLQKQFQEQKELSKETFQIIYLFMGIMGENLSNYNKIEENQITENDQNNCFKICLCLFSINHLVQQECSQIFSKFEDYQDLKDNLEMLMDFSQQILQQDKNFQTFIQFIRKDFQESNKIQIKVLPTLFGMFSNFIIEIQKSFVNDSNYKIVEYKSKLLQDIIKFYLLIFIMSEYKQKVMLFETVFRVCLLFVDKAFNSCKENQEIFTLVQQVLKKIVHQIEIVHLQKLAQNFDQKMKMVLSSLLKQDPRVLQQQQQKIEEQKRQEEKLKQEKGKVKLKMFAN